MELVEATADDSGTLAAYWYELATGMEPYSELNELAHEGANDVESGFEQLLDDDATIIYLLVADETEVGYLMLREGEHPSRTLGSYVDIVDLFVGAGHRGEGYGSAAIEGVKAIAREREADYVEVSCEWYNDGARRFYEDNGFTEKQVTYVQRLEYSSH